MIPIIAPVAKAVLFPRFVFLFPVLLIAGIILLVRGLKVRGLALIFIVPVCAFFFAAFGFFVVRSSPAPRPAQPTAVVQYDSDVPDSGFSAVNGLPAPAPYTETVPSYVTSSEPVSTSTITAEQSIPPAVEPPRAAPLETIEPTPTLPVAASPAPQYQNTDAFDERYANNYPSSRSAAAAVTRRVLNSLDKVIPNGVKLDSLVITQGTNTITTRAIRADVAEAARAILPNVKVLFDEPPPDARAGENRVTLKLDVSAVNPGQSRIVLALIDSADTPGVTDSADAVTKPWVQGEPTQIPGAHTFVVHSDLCNDSGTAQRQAADKAVGTLKSLVESRLARSSTMPLSNSDERWLAIAVRDDFHAHGHVVDSFAQEISPPYGHLWRQSLQVAVTDSDLTNMVQQYHRELDQRRTGARSTLLMAAGLCLGIIVLYLFLNAATKGYYMWPLRLFGVVTVVAGVFIVLRMA